MQKEFENYIQQNRLCSKEDLILVTVSGGSDSVVLLHLFIQSGYSVALAHCNFNLRSKESDGDELFVRNLAATFGIQGHFIAFNTKEYAIENKISIEMAARDLRYNWFQELQQKYNYSKIATGHHLNDSLETVFINMMRGTGINGITGIKAQNGKIIRPLLFATREKIEGYALSNQLEYRTDSSNETNEYVRNIIRNQIIPKFKELNPSFEETMCQNINHFAQAASIFNQQIQNVKDNLWVTNGITNKISIEKLLKQKDNQTYLFEFISPYGFSQDAVTKILLVAEKEAGRIFYSTSHKILIDREYILLEENTLENPSFFINNLDDFASLPINIKTSLYSIDEFKMVKINSIACLDADKINYPLSLRKWNSGDSFYPLGMNQKKKLSDFFIDQKLDRFQKEKSWLLESDGKIIWVVGLRIDNRFKITPETKNVLKLTLQ